ncbi:hypothetical protein BWQ96_04856 [Gracilariopsis chorda]|uniref:BD-FAE-like domain-containing protein n=1 Tax=Gracilariopsis chorda TaxID=448386 RepID=A0A2V3IT88_9FLOR|nr:hypothetical protein BWQ96_04856 [Gracilariopsis chorda]|eukprot:PXF45336.1 hypothetical protein BWQ96_04856 [Gracilariopsis chorda]
MATQNRPTNLSYGVSPSQFIYIHYPTATNVPCPLVFFIHGGFWKSRYGIDPPTAACETIAPDLQQHGFICAEIEYRRSEDSPWGWPHTNHDVLTAYKTVLDHASHSVRTSKVIVVGHSAGGTLALWLGAQLVKEHFPVLPAYIYALAPVADLRMAVRMRLSDDGDAVQRYMHGTPKHIPGEYDKACPTALATHLACLNIRLVAGSADTDVPPSLAKRLCNCVRDAAVFEDRARGSLVLDVFTRAAHYDMVNAGSAVWTQLRDSMKRIP